MGMENMNLNSARLIWETGSSRLWCVHIWTSFVAKSSKRMALVSISRWILSLDHDILLLYVFPFLNDKHKSWRVQSTMTRSHPYLIDRSDVTSDSQLSIKLAYMLSQRSISFFKSLLNLEEIFADMRWSDDFGIVTRICRLLIWTRRPLVRGHLIWKDWKWYEKRVMPRNLVQRSFISRLFHRRILRVWSKMLRSRSTCMMLQRIWVIWIVFVNGGIWMELGRIWGVG